MSVARQAQQSMEACIVSEAMCCLCLCCSLDYQSGPRGGGVSALRVMLARLPARAHSVYYRDEIGNISTSHLRTDFDKVSHCEPAGLQACIPVAMQ